MTEAPATLWYFADPMCSWCWGFASVIEAIRAEYASRLRPTLILGGLRPGTTEPLSPAGREEILHHWHEVQRRTQQPFAFEGALPQGFVYDTEPPSRAVIAVGELRPGAMFDYFHSVQEAFYAHGRDVTRVEVLEDLAVRLTLDADTFRATFESETLHQLTQQHFHVARRAGVRGFPTAVVQRGEEAALLTHGYQAFEELRPRLETWLSAAG